MNQHTPHELRQSPRILEFVRAHPECTTKEIRAAFNLGLDRIGCCLTRLRDAGLVTSEKLPNDRSLRWSAIDADLVEDVLRPRQATVKAWAPHLVRHWLDAAFYGAPA